ncbi:MAG: hypothetical protein E7649_03045 [Ruminococcaceae bacterium]|nr:hypothetical protein [Oscillospiraceae bacterium]
MKFRNKTLLRLFFVGAVFVAICVLFLVRLINIAATSQPNKIQTGTYQREEIIEAQRGEIYDRNGNKLVYNSYTYDLALDYDAMAATQQERNYDILTVLGAIDAMGSSGKLNNDSFPFDGTYPNYTYKAQAVDGDSNMYYRLLKRIAQNELEDECETPKTELTVSYLDSFYKQSPQAFPSETEILNWYLTKYKLVSEDGVAEFADAEMDKLIRMRYDMEVNDFSVYNKYTVIKGVDMKFITYMEELSVAGVTFTANATRQYSYPGYASHILGQVGKIQQENWSYYQSLGYDMNDVVGINGCEQAFESYLRGQDGIRQVTEDENGNVIDSKIIKTAVAGKDVYLTIDIELQIAAEDGLERNVNNIPTAEGGAICALDPNSGEILALASYPTFDLSTYNEDYDKLSKDPSKPYLNRALNEIYAPGSTFKVGMAAAGISSGKISSSTILDCSGKYTYYKDYQPTCLGVHGDVNAAYSLQVSCNCYYYELGRRMGIDLMNEYCEAYGFGQHTGVELREEVGILAGPAYRDENGLEHWTAGNTISAAIGQSDNSVTPIQLASYIATVLNGGTRYSAHLLKEVREYGSGRLVIKSEKVKLGEVSLSADALEAAKTGMRRMVRNSATVSTYMSDVPVTVGGKTGTAQRGGDKLDNGLFVCAAPYDDPEIVVSSVIESSGSGALSTYAASRVLAAYYND